MLFPALVGPSGLQDRDVPGSAVDGCGGDLHFTDLCEKPCEIGVATDVIGKMQHWVQFRENNPVTNEFELPRKEKRQEEGQMWD